MSKKNDRRAKQRRLQHQVLQEKAAEQKQQERQRRKKDLKDITQLLDSVDIAAKTQDRKPEIKQTPKDKPKSSVYNKIRSMFSGSKRRDSEYEMETDKPVSSSRSSEGLILGVRTLKAIKKKKVVAASKLGGSGIAKGTARVSLHPNKPQKPKTKDLKEGLVSPKTVPSRLKNIVRRANKRCRKGAVVVSPMKP